MKQWICENCDNTIIYDLDNVKITQGMKYISITSASTICKRCGTYQEYNLETTEALDRTFALGVE